MRKTLSVLFFIALLCLPVFAEANVDNFTVLMADGSGTSASPFSGALNLILYMLTGAVVGMLFGAKFVINIVKAYGDRENGDGEALKKAIIRFVVAVGVIVLAESFIYSVFKELLIGAF